MFILIRIIELADAIFKREKNLSEETIADLGYIKIHAKSILSTAYTDEYKEWLRSEKSK